MSITDLPCGNYEPPLAPSWVSRATSRLSHESFKLSVGFSKHSVGSLMGPLSSL